MYWPSDKEEPISVDDITVHLLNVSNPTDDYTVRTFSISIRNREVSNDSNNCKFKERLVFMVTISID